MDPELLWLWHRQAAVALIRPLAWETLYAVDLALKKKKKRQEKKKKKERKRKKEKRMQDLGGNLTSHLPVPPFTCSPGQTLWTSFLDDFPTPEPSLEPRSSLGCTTVRPLGPVPISELQSRARSRAGPSSASFLPSFLPPRWPDSHQSLLRKQ